ncbi:AAA family ATPase [Candidatus Uhrbacteria bacterium CG10_big_fil_rev_8_21_14_0_10_50_16]|uniref:AAA family ATPase n=1 Tax=Candidatus Uhrbacteria bacterium CG10_big_fil_rev_8_21_14_0_10_50_16 TaxID=1975039 RepID=A0A2H0RMW7_9BACT|nr:MAG: AAA family ATPase [Candidatus Uhrbacteria bacterium CG10_big_fil_rev_8_21_14_0_10_50_16]
MKKPAKKQWPTKTPIKSSLPSLRDGNGKLIKITKEFEQAYALMENSDDHVFLTGRAGTGKSTLLKYFRTQSNKKHVVLAPTGVAALNVKGQTIHSFFGFHPNINAQLVRKASRENLEFFEKLETIIIDEISMVRADLLDCVDRALRLNRNRMQEAFGGVQMIFIGDLFQLPPVVTRDDQHRFETEYASPYFFSSTVMQGTDIRVIELQHVHRQKEQSFVDLLNNVRTGSLKAADILEWNQLHSPYFDPTESSHYVVHLTTTNKMAQQRNDHELKQLPGQEWVLKAKTTGELTDRKMPSEATLKVKENARIMFTTNDPAKKWVNGSLGIIRRVQKHGLSKFPTLEVELEDGTLVDVAQYKWEVFEYQLQGGHFEETVVGSYLQYPITLAWAVTIHKAQGKTFDHVLVDIGWGAFAHGQMYVALSRCTTFKGITLLKPFRSKDVIVDQSVLTFMERANASS